MNTVLTTYGAALAWNLERLFTCPILNIAVKNLLARVFPSLAFTLLAKYVVCGFLQYFCALTILVWLAIYFTPRSMLIGLNRNCK